jgi:hypothetical protein
MLQFSGATAFQTIALINLLLMINYMQYELIFRRVHMVTKSVYFLRPVHVHVRPSIHMYQHGFYWTDFSEIWF